MKGVRNMSKTTGKELEAKGFRQWLHVVRHTFMPSGLPEMFPLLTRPTVFIVPWDTRTVYLSETSATLHNNLKIKSPRIV